MRPFQIYRLAVLAAFVAAAMLGCGQSQHDRLGGARLSQKDRVEQAMAKYAEVAFKVDPPGPAPTRVVGVRCQKEGDLRFGGANVFTCEVEAENLSVWETCAAYLNDTLYLGGGKYGCEDGDFEPALPE